mgnify:CR=1 FL=1
MTTATATSSSNVLELFENGEYVQFLSQLDHIENQTEDMLLAKGVAMLHLQQFSSANNVFLHNQFTARQEEATIYKQSAINCCLISSLELGLKLMEDGNFESSLIVYDNVSSADSSAGNCDALSEVQ